MDETVREPGLCGHRRNPSLSRRIRESSGQCSAEAEADLFVKQKAEELGVPVLVHTGPETIPLLSKFGRPIYLDEVCNSFPDLKIVAAHAAYCWWEELAELASNKANLYIDLAAWQTKTRRRKDLEFYRDLRKIMNTVGARRILLGSDYPSMKPYMSQKNWVNVFQEIPDYVKEAGIEFRPEEIDLVLGGTAAKVLGLEE